VYLEVLHRVDLRVNEALGLGKGWRLRNACPACLYKVEGKPELEFSFMATADGNSAKCTNEFLRNAQERIDTREPCDEHWLSQVQVNRFADEVAAQSVSAKYSAAYACTYPCKPTTDQKERQEVLERPDA
jgi:hypothetical protein